MPTQRHIVRPGASSTPYDERPGPLREEAGPGRRVVPEVLLLGDAVQRQRGVGADRGEVGGEPVDVQAADVLVGAVLERREVVATVGKEVVGKYQVGVCVCVGDGASA